MKNLKLYLAGFFLVGACAVSYYGCKKKDNTTASCSDGIQNQNETGVDCGGPCPACSTSSGSVTAPCTPAANTVTFKGTANVFTTSCGLNSTVNKFDIAGTGSAGDVTVRLPSTTAPAASRTYTLVGNPTLSGGSPDEATIEYREAYGYVYYPTSGTLYINIVSGKVKATFCNINFQTNSTTGTVVGTGSVSCP